MHKIKWQKKEYGVIELRSRTGAELPHPLTKIETFIFYTVHHAKPLKDVE